jgi:hypothetical protein
MFLNRDGRVDWSARHQIEDAGVCLEMKFSLWLVGAAAIAGCSTLASRPEDVRATHAIPTAPAAEIITGRSEGYLEYRGGCLFLTRDGENRRMRLLVIWPTSSRFDGRRVVPGETTTPISFGLGEEILIEGSAPDWAPYLIRTYPQLGKWQAQCGERPLFVATVRRAR